MKSTQLVVVAMSEAADDHPLPRTNLLRDFLAFCIATNPCLKSEESRRLLRMAVDRWEEFLGLPPMLQDFSDGRMVAFIHYREGMKKAPATIEREVSKLGTLWRAAAARNLIHPPTYRLCKTPPPVPEALDKAEIRKLLRAAQRADRQVVNVNESLYFPALFGVLWDTSARISETLHVTRADISFIGPSWWIRGAWITFRVRKGGAAAMKKRVRDWTARRLSKLITTHQWEKPFGFAPRSSLYGPARRIYAAAGLTRTRSVFHVIRRSHASHLDAYGGDAQKSLGHAYANTTRDFYIDPRISKPAQSVDKLFAPMGITDRVIGAIRNRFAS